MDYITALAILHEKKRPARYVEIGCRKGCSLSLARCPAVAVDPDFQIESPLHSPTKIFRSASDAFFDEHDLERELGGSFDLAFIDGMHLAEFVLRDFIHLEKHSHEASVIVIDDVLPSTSAMATRERTGQAWTGDVFKIIRLLREHRPDLRIEVFDIEMKGLAVISHLNRRSTSLAARLAELEASLQKDGPEPPDTDQIRAWLAPRPVEEFETYVTDELVAFSTPTTDREAHAPDPTTTISKYLSLMKSSLIGEVYLDSDLRIFYLMECLNDSEKFDYEIFHDIRNKRPEDYQALKLARQEGYLFKRRIENAGFSHTMAGRKRLDQLHQCLDRVRTMGIPGDFVECGVWRGGSSIFAKAYFDSWNMDRKVWVADSFAGLPAPAVEQDAKLDLSAAKFPQLAVSQEVVRQNFEAYGHLDDRVHFLKGWFKDTLHIAAIDQISILRLDGDLYESTMDALTALYEKLTPGGIIIVDDYYALPQCKAAVSDYFSATKHIEPDWIRADWSCVQGVKPA